MTGVNLERCHNMNTFKIRILVFCSLSFLLTFGLYLLLGGSFSQKAVEAYVDLQTTKPFEIKLFDLRTASSSLWGTDGSVALKGRSDMRRMIECIKATFAPRGIFCADASQCGSTLMWIPRCHRPCDSVALSKNSS